MNNQDTLTPAEERAFESLRDQMMPDTVVEQNIINTLHNKGLLVKRRSYGWVMKVAATLLLLAIGFVAGLYFTSASSEQSDFNYMLVLYEDESFTPGEPQAMFEEYSKWMTAIYEQGIAIDGQEMKPASIMLSSETTQTVKRAEGKTVGGYFVLKAKSLEQAVAIARDSPHLKYGGVVEVKEFMIR